MGNNRKLPLKRFLGSLSRALALASTSTILLMLVVILIGFFFRALRFSFSGVVEATEFLVLISIFLGFAYVQYKNTHIKMELLTPIFPPWLRSAVHYLSSLMALFFFSAIMYGGVLMVLESYAVGEYEVGLRSIPMWTVRVFIPIGSLAVILVSIGDLLKGIANFIHKDRS
jgi:TRAP-type C4-dicarboxylate transport system permease small subunit